MSRDWYRVPALTSSTSCCRSHTDCSNLKSWCHVEPRSRPCAALIRACKHKELHKGSSVSKTMRNNAWLFCLVIFCTNLIRRKRERPIIILTYLNETSPAPEWRHSSSCLCFYSREARAATKWEKRIGGSGWEGQLGAHHPSGRKTRGPLQRRLRLQAHAASPHA